MKYLKIEMINGETWEVPADVIAVNRAKWYAAYDTGTNGGEEYDKIFQDEYEFVIQRDLELLYWVSNSMDWNDIKDSAKLVDSVPRDIQYEELWNSAGMSIEERDNDI